MSFFWFPLKTQLPVCGSLGSCAGLELPPGSQVRDCSHLRFSLWSAGMLRNPCRWIIYFLFFFGLVSFLVFFDRVVNSSSILTSDCVRFPLSGAESKHSPSSQACLPFIIQIRLMLREVGLVPVAGKEGNLSLAVGFQYTCPLPPLVLVNPEA